MKWLTSILVCVLCLTGCGVKVLPKPTATALLDASGKSLSWTSKGVSMSVKLADMDVARTQRIDRVASFAVTVANQTAQALTIPVSSFVLLDDQGKQVNPITAEELLRLVSRESFYLIPYPYFGYYYLQNQARLEALNASTSPLPYFPETHPQAILTEAFPEQPILPGAQVSGLVYFQVEFSGRKQVEFRAYLPGTTASAAPDFSFPFSVEK